LGNPRLLGVLRKVYPSFFPVFSARRQGKGKEFPWLIKEVRKMDAKTEERLAVSVVLDLVGVYLRARKLKEKMEQKRCEYLEMI
jgi:hypothetical protein